MATILPLLPHLLQLLLHLLQLLQLQLQLLPHPLTRLPLPHLPLRLALQQLNPTLRAHQLPRPVQVKHPVLRCNRKKSQLMCSSLRCSCRFHPRTLVQQRG
ncbi:hypothetical protein GUITHDRAFT_150578 [Guillardia theta CCMP2712]|uniref:Secreted protein n=1 Tax=Guillardia theta (strain CCMP2712) TaxID=905079 RepID=L1JWQ1_GUITC|nr:hypothetical protein GUITHDRAFT_150578 [Guillardia theta CCMP2712]EKX52533.1 hypothetical protein GUITHDRAFT_150578 [Guillardia theta CCMP2712]|eukprot:XP_005839513.1 hypothetical protein GUITHDRAFT_150578 [Guillardia theta CCMP2712]